MVDFGICDSPVIANMPELGDKCNAETLTLQDMASASMGLHPDVPYAWIQSKRDIVQEAYYDAIGLTMEEEIDVIDDEIFFLKVNGVFADYVKDHKNAVTYMVSSLMHTYTGLPIVYHATADGALGGGKGETMLEWLSRFPLGKNETVDSVCDGDVIPMSEHPKVYTKYCAEEVVQSYTQQ